jgi:hypothetical protein
MILATIETLVATASRGRAGAVAPVQSIPRRLATSKKVRTTRRRWAMAFPCS